MLVTEQFLKGLIEKYGKHSISTDDGGPWYPPQACKFLKIKHHHIRSYYYEKEALLKGLSNI